MSTFKGVKHSGLASPSRNLHCTTARITFELAVREQMAVAARTVAAIEH